MPYALCLMSFALCLLPYAFYLLEFGLLLNCLIVDLYSCLVFIKKVAKSGEDLTGTDVLVLVLVVLAGVALLGFLWDRYDDYR